MKTYNKILLESGDKILTEFNDTAGLITVGATILGGAALIARSIYKSHKAGNCVKNCEGKFNKNGKLTSKTLDCIKSICHVPVVIQY
jgi:hypothetical protein